MLGSSKKRMGARPLKPSWLNDEDAARLPRRVVLADLHDGVARAAAAVDVVVGPAVAVDVVEEDLPHVVAHDVEHDLHPAVVRVRRPSSAGVARSPKCGVELREVLLPVAVVAVDVRVAVDVLDDRARSRAW